MLLDEQCALLSLDSCCCVGVFVFHHVFCISVVVLVSVLFYFYKQNIYALHPAFKKDVKRRCALFTTRASKIIRHTGKTNMSDGIHVLSIPVAILRKNSSRWTGRSQIRLFLYLYFIGPRRLVGVLLKSLGRGVMQSLWALGQNVAGTSADKNRKATLKG